MFMKQKFLGPLTKYFGQGIKCPQFKLKSACDIVFAGFSAGGPFQGTAIKTPAGWPCGLVGVSEFLEP